MIEGRWGRVGVGALVVLWVASGLALGRTLVPDVSLYVSGASGEPWWFPSPGGRFLGSGGVAVLGLVSLVSAFYLGASIAASSTSPIRSALILTLFPASWYLGALGVSLPALALASRGRGVIAASVHPATALAWSSSRRAWVAGLVLSVFLAATTAYGGAASVGVLDRLTGFALGLPFAFALVACSSWALEVAVSSGVGLALMAVQGHVQLRYLLPAAVIGAMR